MSKNLVIVESPTKTKPIEKYLGKDYIVLSSKGHVRDLSTTGKFGLGVDVDDNFKPNYVLMKGKKSVVKELKSAASSAKHVYLATDPDREGEAISWHLFKVLGLDDNNYDRVVFNEITKNAVLDAFHHTRKIDTNLVNSQETRRILDRIIGFRLSKFIKAKTNGGSSAGRVQSVALKLIVEKEKEIKSFIPEEYFTIDAHFDNFSSSLFKYKDDNLEIKSQEANDKILSSLGDEFVVQSITEKKKDKNSKFPFITSTLAQDASNKLNFSAKRTMQIAQKLYEGKDIGEELVGLITYMRTDSIRLSNDFVSATYDYINDKYGKEYVGKVKISKKKDNVQDAHEAIRPTDIKRTPESIKKYLTNDEFKLYRMIYYRTLASLMSPAKTLNTTVILDNNDYKFKATGQIITFDGYLKVYSDYEDNKDVNLPNLKESEVLKANSIESEKHLTNPPARYTESKLIKEMENLGIGRPSTYATTIDIIKKRGYVTVEDKKFHPTEIGFEITDKLADSFSNLINVEYTANMENDLDKIALGDENYIKVLDDFYKEFEPSVEKALENIKKELVLTGDMCPTCGSALVIRNGRYGKFTACSNFPTCKYVKNEPREENICCECPKCNGKIVEKRSKKGKIFYGCNNFPKCKCATWDMPVGELCPECHEMLVTKNGKIRCSSCDYEK